MFKGSLSFQDKGAGLYINGNIVFFTDSGTKVWTKVCIILILFYFGLHFLGWIRSMGANNSSS